jgi:hypothetical protein
MRARPLTKNVLLIGAESLTNSRARQLIIASHDVEILIMNVLNQEETLLFAVAW